MKNPFPKLRILTARRFQQVIDEAVDKAVTVTRQNLTWDNSLPGFDIKDSNREYLYEEAPRLKLTEKDFKVRKGAKINEATLTYLSDSFVTNPSAVRLQTRDELYILQDAAVSKYIADPHAASIVNNIRYYTIGSGVYVKVADPKIKEVIRTFNYKNRMDQRSKRMVQMGYLKGEYFLIFYVNPKDGEIYVRPVPPGEIQDIETDPEDVETTTAYHRVAILADDTSLDKWYLDLDFFIRKSNGEPVRSSSSVGKTESNTYMLFVKYGLEDEVRGRVPIYSILKFLKYYEDFLVDRIRLNHERSKVVWIKSITGRSPEALTKDRKAPRGGTMLVENENVKYRIESAKLESADAERDGLLLLYHIGSGVGMPLHILDQRADQAVYASIKKSDTPFSQMIMDHQDFWFAYFDMIYRALLYFKVKAGQLPKTTKVKSYLLEAQVEAARYVNQAVVEGVPKEEIIEVAKKILANGEQEVDVPTEQVPLDIIFPDVVSENLLEQAQVLQIHSQIGIASRSTLSSKAGYNWQVELKNLLSEMAMFAPPEEGTPGRKPTPRNDRTNPSAPKTNKN